LWWSRRIRTSTVPSLWKNQSSIWKAWDNVSLKRSRKKVYKKDSDGSGGAAATAVSWLEPNRKNGTLI
jgi:hypothetical protein